jgi:aspartate/methionine/tyrosine aminotransferase
MKHRSIYLEWYIKVPKLKYDLRSSGVSAFKFPVNLGEIDLSVNHAHGNPKTVELLAERYGVATENLFLSTEGASGQNARIIRVLSEKNPRKREAVVEYPTYEPLLRSAQEYFPIVKRLERNEKENYRLDTDNLRRVVSSRTGLLVLTNPHLPSGVASTARELKEIMEVANEYDFFVLCDEIYAEFNRDALPTIFSLDKKRGIVTTGFSKAYGLGGLKMGAAIADEALVEELTVDTLSTVGVFSNIAEITMTKLLTDGYTAMEKNMHGFLKIKKIAQKLLDERGVKYLPNDFGITFWVKTSIKDTYKWTDQQTIPKYSLATVPGAFFLFKDGYELTKSDMIRLGLGSVNPDEPNLTEAFEVLEKALRKL